MAIKPEGGNKKGHSRMAHRVPTAEVKADARRTRRAERRVIRNTKYIKGELS